MKEKRKKSILFLVFLGARGGGLELLLYAAYKLSGKYAFTIITSERIEFDFEKHFECKVLRIPTISKIQHLLNFKRLIQIAAHLISIERLFFTKQTRPQAVLQIMPSPLDLFVDFLAIRNNVPIVRCIHDAKRHPGEKWPWHSSLRRRIRNADEVITFSRHVSKSIKDIFGFSNCNVCYLPTDFQDLNQLKTKSVESTMKLVDDSRKVLFVGRIREYKGLEILSKACQNSDSKFDLIIAGEGRIKVELPHNRKTIVVNRWLSNNELLEFISQSNVVVFPYIEASQSGLIPICMKQGKNLIVSRLPGLSEQVEGYSQATLFDAGNSVQLSNALDEVLQHAETKDSTFGFRGVQNGEAIENVVHRLVSKFQVKSKLIED